MGKSHKFFRYLWRVNAVLILVAAGAVTFGIGALLVQEFGTRAARSREADAGIPVAGPNVNSNLLLGRASVVEGTEVMRASLQRNSDQTKFSSGGYSSETRNILFIEPGEKAARWLLPDNDHVIVETSDITDEKDANAKRVAATAVLVKSATEPPESVVGKLLLFDPPGKRIVEVATNVRQIHVASISGGELRILYERDRRLVLAVFDPRSIAKLREQEIQLPQLK
jgi:hypothetical protein